MRPCPGGDITINVDRPFVQVKESVQLTCFKVRWALFRKEDEEEETDG